MNRQAHTAAAPVPVTILAGYLGAGKTTLLDRLLREAGGIRYGVLVNDFAALNIDAELIAEAGPDRIALANGCICCTVRDDLLAAALDLVRTAPPPDRILIECSGVSDPRAVARALTGELAGAAFAVDAIVCLVDAANVMALGYEETETVIDQAAAADLVAITKCDLVDPLAADDVENLLRDAQPALRIIRTTSAALPLALVSGAIEADTARPAISCGGPDRDRGPRDHGHTHGDAFTSHAWQRTRPLPLDAFMAAVRALPASVYRAKGILHFAERPGQRAVFHLVGRRSELTFEPCDDDAPASALVAIGRADGFDARAFDFLFANAASPRPIPEPSSIAAIGGTQ